MHAHHLFEHKGEFQLAIDILKSINASPTDVIDLFPEFNLLDGRTAKSTDNLALYALIEYLTEQRCDLIKILLSEETTICAYDSIASLCEVIDTNLLYAYVQSKNPLLSSLLRTKNYCTLSTTEELLRSYGVIHNF